MEMFGMIGGLAGAGASLAGGIMNAEEAEETRQMNWAIAVMNYQQRERERTEAIAMANKLRGEQKLGTTDIRGTRTHFVPGRGWVVEGAPDVLAMQKLQDAEQRKVLQHDLPQLRAHRDRNEQRSFGEEALAETYRQKLGNRFVPDDQAYEGLLLQSQTNMLDRAGRDAGRRLFTNVGRTGGNQRAYEETARTLARTTNEAYADAGLKAKLLSRGMGQREADERDKGLANLYNLFATRAGALPNVSYKPQNLDDAGTLASAQQGLLTAGNLATGAFGKKGGELDYLSPNMGWGNAVAGAGSALASAFRGMGASGQAGRGQVQGFGATGDANGNDIYTGTEGDWVQV
jgi:hypothetical protein